MATIHEAIQALRPGKEFTMYGDDPTTIIWNDSTVETPSKKEIDDSLKNLLQKEENNKLAKEAKKEAIATKLGLTIEELEALLA